MSLKIKKASDIIEYKTIKTLLYGEPGIGKTTLSMTAPRTLMVDCDAGIRRVDPRFRTNYIEVNSWIDIAELLSSEEQLKDYDTVVIDTVGKLLEFLSANIISGNHKLGSKTGGLTLQGYGALLSEFRAFNSNLSRIGKNIIYLAHDVELKDGDKSKFRPDITGKSLGSVLREMDLVGYMQSRNNERTISFTPNDFFYGKNTCNLPSVINIQDLNINSTAKPMTDIFNLFKKMMDSQHGVMIEYSELIQNIEIKIEKIFDSESANIISEEIKALNEIWDSNTIAKIKMREKISELNLKYNKDTKSFEQNNTSENES